ncbi:hypothetical protein ABET36_02140 [Caldifermentibacillus hisashii]|nr:hypothetical protein [Caldifermentibacillus hisashii]
MVNPSFVSAKLLGASTICITYFKNIAAGRKQYLVNPSFVTA